MLLKWNDPAVRLTGRWSRNNPDCATATANGSYFEFAFRGRVAVMHFDVTLNAAPYPHLYVEIDGENRVEAPLDQYLRVFAKDADANHVARVILKGSVEMQPRWFQPLVGRTALLGIEVEERGVLPADDRKIVEFVGDSITEGVLIDADYAEKPAYTWDQHNRVYQDDVTATYGWLTAEALNDAEVRITLQRAGSTIGVIGTGEAMKPVTVSSAIEMQQYIAAVMKEYDLSYVLTDNVKNALSGVKVTLKYIGTLSELGGISGKRFEIGLYEVPEGCCGEEKQLRLSTLATFSRGMDEYRAGHIREARSHFIEVLRVNRGDLIARHYLMLCEGGDFLKENKNELKTN